MHFDIHTEIKFGVDTSNTKNSSEKVTTILKYGEIGNLPNSKIWIFWKNSL